MEKRILINREECEVRVAFLEGEDLAELHTEPVAEKSIVGNIYRGVVKDVKPGLQAAFVDCGLERNVFIHFMDIRAESLVIDEGDDPYASMRAAAEKGIPGQIIRPGRRPRQDVSKGQAEPPVKAGDHLIVQVVKEEIGGKAPRVSANISIPGRYLVLLPFPSQQGGVSRKIAMGEDRYKLKKLLAKIRNEDCSFIVRTAGVSQPEEAIQQDVEYLVSVWGQIVERYRAMGKPGLIFNEHDIVGRLVRDAMAPDVDEILVDSQDDFETVRAQLEDYAPDLVDSVTLYKGPENIFDAYDVEKHIQRALSRKVWLKSGGFLVIDENEALTAIDVNTGRFTGSKEQEKTSFKTNMEACRTIAQQIRLRDIGGIIVVDFIDMLSRDNQNAVADEMARQLKRDRAKMSVGRLGEFGILTITRKRQKMSLQKHVFELCPYCQGSGKVLKPDQLLRKLKYELKTLVADAGRPYSAIVVTAHPHFATLLRDKYEQMLERLLGKGNTELILRADLDYHIEHFSIQPVKRLTDAYHRVVGVRADSHLLPDADTERDIRPVGTPESDMPEVAASAPAATNGARFDPKAIDEPIQAGRFTRVERAADDEDGDEETTTTGARPAQSEDGGTRRRRRRRRRGGRDRVEGAQPAGAAKAPQDADFTEGAFEPEDSDGAYDDADGDDRDASTGAPAAPQGDGDAQGEGRRRRRRGSRGGRRRRAQRDGEQAPDARPAALANEEPAEDSFEDEEDEEESLPTTVEVIEIPEELAKPTASLAAPPPPLGKLPLIAASAPPAKQAAPAPPAKQPVPAPAAPAGKPKEAVAAKPAEPAPAKPSLLNLLPTITLPPKQGSTRLVQIWPPPPKNQAPPTPAPQEPAASAPAPAPEPAPAPAQPTVSLAAPPPATVPAKVAVAEPEAPETAPAPEPKKPARRAKAAAVAAPKAAKQAPAPEPPKPVVEEPKPLEAEAPKPKRTAKAAKPVKEETPVAKAKTVAAAPAKKAAAKSASTPKAKKGDESASDSATSAKAAKAPAKKTAKPAEAAKAAKPKAAPARKTTKKES
ncbi:MAG: Rne/Rng family ribonuclease [Candidatus Sumerlaeia bacterium]|nr:Rne/Rng family ribonuclease [Candidatus Sumerlaeia bacterium]